MSIIIMCLTTLFALLKLQFMLMRKQPDVTTFIEMDHHGPPVIYNTVEKEFMFAVSA